MAPSAFRFHRPGTSGRLIRARLLDPLADRFDQRITAVVAGAGFGKSTLISQAMEQNLAESAGHDVWLTCTPADTEPGALIAGLAQAISGLRMQSADPEMVADLVWQKSPAEVSLIIDDVHLLVDTPGAKELSQLLNVLPDNGHLVLVGRKLPDLPLARLRSLGLVTELDQQDLAFDQTELADFAASRNWHVSEANSLARWPALAEMQALAGTAGALDYLQEEVLGQLDPERMPELAAAVCFRSLDDALASAITGRTTSAADLVESMPLTDDTGDGAVRLHELWADVLRLDDYPDGVEALQRGVAHLCSIHNYGDAFDAAMRVGREDLAAFAVGESVRQAEADIPLSDLIRFERDLPAEVLGEATTALLASHQYIRTDPMSAEPLLRKLITDAYATGDTLVAAAAATVMTRIAYWLRKPEILDVVAPDPDVELDIESPFMMNQHHLVAAHQCLLRGDPDGCLVHLDRIEAETPHPYIVFFRCQAHLDRGDFAMALDVIGQPRLKIRWLEETFLGLGFEARFMLGRLPLRHVASTDDLVFGTADLVQLPHISVTTSSLLSLGYTHFGQLEDARRMLDIAQAVDQSTLGPQGRSCGGMAAVCLAVSEGNEAGATRVLRGLLESLDEPELRVRGLSRSLGTIYVLAPETRPVFDNRSFGPQSVLARDLARAVVAVRDGDPTPALCIDWSKPNLLVPHLTQPHLAELALVAAAEGNEDAAAYLASIHQPRSRLRALVQAEHPFADAATQLMRQRPLPPNHTLRLSLLGPTLLERGDGAALDPAWERRAKVRHLLTYLAVHGRTPRETVIEAIWPEHEPKSGLNNLRVTLSHLQSVLEPERAGKEVPWFIDSVDDSIGLRIDERFTIDTLSFDALIEKAGASDGLGRPAQALEHYTAAIDLYRGDYLADLQLDYPDWGMFDRLRYQTDFVRASVRASQLLAGRGALDRAITLAGRGIDVAPLTDAPYVAQAHAYGQRGDRDSARTVLATLFDRLRAEDLEPETASVVLAGRFGVDNI